MFDKLNKKHGLLLENRSDRAYFSKIDISEGYLLYCETPVYFTDSRYISMAKEKLKDSGIESVLFEGFKSIKSVIKSKKIKQLYIDYTHTTLSTYEKYREFGVKLLDGRQYIENKRKIKSADEIRSIEKS